MWDDMEMKSELRPFAAGGDLMGGDIGGGRGERTIGFKEEERRRVSDQIIRECDWSVKCEMHGVSVNVLYVPVCWQSRSITIDRPLPTCVRHSYVMFPLDSSTPHPSNTHTFTP